MKRNTLRTKERNREIKKEMEKWKRHRERDKETEIMIQRERFQKKERNLKTERDIECEEVSIKWNSQRKSERNIGIGIIRGDMDRCKQTTATAV